MKKYLLLLAIISISCSDSNLKKNDETNNKPLSERGQSNQNVRRAVNLLQPQKFHLNSKNKSMISGRSKTELFIELPANTKEWYYYVCASKENSTNYIELATQLGVLLANPRIDVNKIKVKDGNSYCDVYLMDRENMEKFKKGESFSYHAPGSRNNFNSGVIQVKNIPGYNWLVIANPRQAHAVDITVEVVAIIEN